MGTASSEHVLICSGVAIIQAAGAVAPVKNSELIRVLGLDQPTSRSNQNLVARSLEPIVLLYTVLPRLTQTTMEPPAKKSRQVRHIVLPWKKIGCVE